MSNVLKEKLQISEIKKLFINGIKLSKKDFKIGIEYERLPIITNKFEAAPYGGIDGICEILRLYARNENFDYLLDKTNIIGLKKLHNTLTLEPGSQVEISLKPHKSIQELQEKIQEFDDGLIPLLNEFGISLLNYGISPVSTYKNINLIPKRRYKIMASYLWGILSDVMMRETAGIQATFDFDSEEDAMQKFRVANMLSPIATAMFANSPIRGGVDTGYKSFRALSWLNTDAERCGFAYKFDKNYSFEKYINTILNTPMIMFQRNEEIYTVNGSMTLLEFIQKEYQGHCANIEDFKLSANLYFPDVRLRKFIEIRNQDCVGQNLQYSIIAFHKGILYSNDILNEVDKLLSKYKYQDFAELRYNVPKYALDTKLGDTKLKDLANELLNMSESGLKAQGLNESKYLEPIQDLIYQGICPADIILKNWYGCWNKNLNKFIEYLIQ